jgi:hypothetical protein
MLFERYCLTPNFIVSSPTKLLLALFWRGLQGIVLFILLAQHWVMSQALVYLILMYRDQLIPY